MSQPIDKDEIKKRNINKNRKLKMPRRILQVHVDRVANDSDRRPELVGPCGSARNLPTRKESNSNFT